MGQPVRFTARITRPDPPRPDGRGAQRVGPADHGRAPVRCSVPRTPCAAGSPPPSRDVLPAEQAAMLPALVLGDTSAVSPETVREFRAAGMTHLTAVSGANVTIVCAAVLFSRPADRPAGGGGARRGGAGGVRHRRAADGERVAGGRDGRHRVGGDAVFAPAASDSGSVGHGADTAGRRSPAGRRCRLRAVRAGDGRADRHRAGSGRGAWPAEAAPSRWRMPSRLRVAAHVVTAPLVAGISGRFSLVAVAANLAVAAVDRADHRAGQRGGRAVRAVAARCAAADPFHRAGTVVGVGRGAAGRPVSPLRPCPFPTVWPACCWSVAVAAAAPAGGHAAVATAVVSRVAGGRAVWRSRVRAGLVAVRSCWIPSRMVGPRDTIVG